MVTERGLTKGKDAQETAFHTVPHCPTCERVSFSFQRCRHRPSGAQPRGYPEDASVVLAGTDSRPARSAHCGVTVQVTTVRRSVNFAGLTGTGVQGKGFKCWEFAAEMVEENGAQCTMDLCKSCYNQKHEERNVPTVKQRQWRRLVDEKSSRAKLAFGSGFLVLEHKLMETYAGKKMHAKNNERGRGGSDCG